MKKFIGEFKKFVSRGNVLDMAVGIIIGSAFTAIVTALTNGILKPVINYLISLFTKGSGIESIYWMLKPVYVLDDAGVATSEIDLSSSIYIDWGALISSIINFFLIAFVLFLILKGINAAKEFQTKNVNMDKIIQYKEVKGIKLTKAEQKYKTKRDEEAKKSEVKEEVKLTLTEELLTEIRDKLSEKK